MFGNRSRFCRYVPCPDTGEDAERCRDFLMRFAERLQARPLLFPTRDHDLLFLARFHEELQSRYRLVAAGPAMLEAILNKAALYEVAREIGIAFPETVWIRSQADVTTVKERLDFPVIVKPLYAAQWRKAPVWDLVGRRKAVVIGDYGELVRFHTLLAPVDPLMHAQEFVPGPDSELVIFGSYVNPERGMAHYFTGRKLLQYPPASGTGVAVQACVVDEIAASSRRLLARLGYCGASEIEYKRDARTGRYVLIEMNPRFWDQHALGAAVGVDLVRAAFLDVTGGGAAPHRQDARRVTGVAEEGWMLALLASLRHGEYHDGDFRRSLQGPLTFAVLRWDDPGPALSIARRVLGDVARSARIAMSRRRVPVASRAGSRP
jgi:predicted ATP-grasp superfamily ATP-dependent carboligase